MSANPLHQFQVHAVYPLDIAGFNLAITNQTIWTGIAVATIILLLVGGLRKPTLIPGRWQAFVEMTYEFIEDLVVGTSGKQALPFLPLIMATFLMISAMNLVGMVPGSFTVTSQITTTAFMGVAVFLMVLGVGIYKQGLHFFAHFLPAGTPAYLAPLIVPLEVISFLARPLTLAVRLAANMVAGHVLLKIFATFVILLMGMGVFAASAVAPLILLIALTGLEVFVALLQAYIFTVLTCVYLNDALGHGHEHTEDDHEGITPAL
ncbi:MAG: F0F1 ATP synthase subunit A [Alphaproteobacteria bacterium CG_4_10_14_0_8_um_filter_53_9]|nr:MAG: F0F1 ATP synthase subunit A [Alphaproteobacteria bacterium CG_4_10_14_0_8_um_filter_53_9]